MYLYAVILVLLVVRILKMPAIRVPDIRLAASVMNDLRLSLKTGDIHSFRVYPRGTPRSYPGCHAWGVVQENKKTSLRDSVVSTKQNQEK